MQARTKWWMTLAAMCGLLVWSPSHASLARNAAGAKNMGEAGLWALDLAGQFQKEADGRSWTAETGLQFQATSRLQLLIEGLPFKLQEPDAGESVRGLGDTDVTLSWLILKDAPSRPSLVLGGRVKLPTADKDLGSGAADYSALAVMGKEIGELELSLETEYATFGSVSGEKPKEQVLYTLTAEYSLSDFLAVYAEAFGNSAPAPGESRTDAALFGLELDFLKRPHATPYLSFEVDTEGASSARAGVEWTW